MVVKDESYRWHHNKVSFLHIQVHLCFSNCAHFHNHSFRVTDGKFLSFLLEEWKSGPQALMKQRWALKIDNSPRKLTEESEVTLSATERWINEEKKIYIYGALYVTIKWKVHPRTFTPTYGNNIYWRNSLLLLCMNVCYINCNITLTYISIQ